MAKAITILNRIFPFSYLTDAEKTKLVENSAHVAYPKGSMLCQAGSSDNLNLLFILLTGRVSVTLDPEVSGTIKAPSYFGERSLFFFQPRKATIQVETNAECLIVDRDIIFELIHENLSFCYGFATSLRNKHKIFEHYDDFMNLLKRKKIATKLRVADLLTAYKNLSPILHKKCRSKDIDYFALAYVMSRLPYKITSTSQLVLGLDSPTVNTRNQPKNNLKKQSTNGREFYEILPGRIFTVLRDDQTDYIDFVTKLCTYVIETRKIRERLLKKPSAIRFLTNYYHNKAKAGSDRDKTIELPFSPGEIKKLQAMFPEDLLSSLYEIVAQNGEIQIQELFTSVRYFSDLSELWIEEIKTFLHRHVPDYLINDNMDIHIISSNTHSVLNCLSPWVHQRAARMIDSDEHHTLDDITDRLYAGIKKATSNRPDLSKARVAAEKKHGIFHLENPGLTGIKVSMIDLSKLSKHIDPALTHHQTQKQSILVNIDYAHGKQAEPIIRNLILLFGKKIKSVSVLGKTGSVVGKRGDLIIPDHFIIQENDFVYETTQKDMFEQDFKDVGCYRKIHFGTMLTVLGTLMQNSEMLWYYRHFWKVAGMEMEGGYFLQEINRAKVQQLIDPNIILRFAYYISDRPLIATETLANKLSLEEGLPAVYAITRVILNKILAQNEK